MKLNNDCIRDLLLYLEENLALDDVILANNICLKNYSFEDIVYTTSKLYEAGFLNCIDNSADDKTFILILSISYQGHQYLDTIRDNKIWAETKNKLSMVTSASIPIIQEIATSFLKMKLGLT